MKLGTEVGLGLRQIVGDPAPLPERGTPQIVGHVCCGQTAGWIKKQLGTEMGLSPGHTVRWDPAPPPTKGHTPNFRPMPVVARRLDGSRCHLVGR